MDRRQEKVMGQEIEVHRGVKMAQELPGALIFANVRQTALAGDVELAKAMLADIELRGRESVVARRSTCGKSVTPKPPTNPWAKASARCDYPILPCWPHRVAMLTVRSGE